MKLVARILLAFAFAALLVPQTAAAAAARSDENIVIPAGQTLTDDLYAAGSEVLIEGTLSGSLIAVGSKVTINGSVTGDVWAAGSEVTVRGTVGGTFRAGGSTVAVSGKVAGDVLAAGNTVSVSGQAGRDAWLGGSTVDVRGPITRNLKAAGSTVTLASPVGGDASVETQRLVLDQGAAIAGTLAYRAPRQAERADEITAGAVSYSQEQQQKEKENYFTAVAAQIYWFLAAVVLLLAILLYARRAAVRAAELVVARPSLSALVGIGFVLLAPLLLLFMLVLVISVPLAAIGFGAYLLVLYSAKLFVALAVGTFLVRTKQDAFWPTFGAGLVGLVLFYLLAALPVVGLFVSVIVVLFGAGAQLLLFREFYEANRKKYGV